MPTLRETPAEAEILSHRLMLRAGLIRKLAAGVYSYMPMGLRALKKVENIVREEMDRAGANELLMSALLPAEAYMASGRCSVCMTDTTEIFAWDLLMRRYLPKPLKVRFAHINSFL